MEDAIMIHALCKKKKTPTKKNPKTKETKKPTPPKHIKKSTEINETEHLNLFSIKT